VDLTGLDLPLAPFLPRISSQLDAARLLVLTAEPGAGKSTLVPAFLLGEPWLAGKRIVMLEPRRLAAAAVATRIAELLGESVGGRAGWRVRGSARVSRETRVEVVTEALLTRAIQEDPLLSGVGLVILDEFHERSLHADLALALALEVRRARPDLALLVMSATLETQSVAAVLGGGTPAPCLHCPGRVHPVTTAHEQLPAERWEEAFARGCARLLDESEGDVLAFLPGAAEIRRVGTALAGVLAGAAEVLALHGSMSLEEQQEVVRPRGGSAGKGGSRRVILATSIAETSLTVPGVRVVADAGFARLARFHPATGLDRLVTERVARSSADQRRGRAGRLGPGTCARFWPESERLVERPDAEVLRADLCGLVLECALWGARMPGELRWVDVPPAPAWSRAEETLRMLGLLGGQGPTARGRRVAGLGLSPRLGALVLEGLDRNEPALAAACAAILAERDGSGIPGDPDFRLRLEKIRAGTGGRDSWRAQVAREAERILRRSGVTSPARGWSASQEQDVGGLLAHAFPDRIARREQDGSYRFVTGRVARFPSSGPGPGRDVAVASRASAPWIAAVDADAGETVGTIRLAAPVAEEEALRVLAPLTTETEELRWEEGLVPRALLARRAGKLLLAERAGRPARAAGIPSFLSLVAERGIAILPWDEASRALLARLRFFGGRFPSRGLGDLSEAGLAARAADWLADSLAFDGGPVLSPARLWAALLGLAAGCSPRLARGELDGAVPESFELPTGSRRRIDYAGQAPVVEAKVQEVYGLSASPRICGVPLAFRLLSPAGRPLQTTADLAGFWAGSWVEVRKQMRGRYPKHEWPEDPASACPTSRAKPRPRRVS
jgi:ATP-dependent helicase HrpB